MLTAAKKHTGQLPDDSRTNVVATPWGPAQDEAEENINFEILTEIQHYGGKTNLIDFTSDYLIALFFACDGAHDNDGRVILQCTDIIRPMIKRPRNPRHRVIAQKSVFIRPPRGFIELCEDDIITIPANLKPAFLEFLQRYHDISTETIYNDLQGFIRHQDIHGGAYTHFYSAILCLLRGDQAVGTKESHIEYKKAVEHYTKATQEKPDFPEAYNNRAELRLRLGDWKKACEDLKTAKDQGVNLFQAFRNDFESVEGFEKKYKVNLPPDIAKMLTKE